LQDVAFVGKRFAQPVALASECASGYVGAPFEFLSSKFRFVTKLMEQADGIRTA
jgi:hypothetical protein